MIYAVLASGESMNQAVADSVRGKCKVLAVSDTYLLAPWADGLVSADAGWWRKKAPQFEGKKYTMGLVSDAEQIKDVPMGTNSGLLALMLAVRLGATKVLLLGVDLKGSHFFGNHPLPLRNPNQARLETFKKQFSEYQPKGVLIVNCNLDSDLLCYPMARLENELEGMAQPAAPDSGKDRSIQDGTAKAGVRRRVRMHASARRQGHSGFVEPDKGRRNSRNSV